MAYYARYEPDENGELQMNGLASIYFVDFDRTRERTRKAKVVVIGE